MDSDDVRTIRLEKSDETFARLVSANLLQYRGQAVQSASLRDIYAALAMSVRNFLVRRFRLTSDAYFKANPKFVYYLSAEYLLGRAAHPEPARHRHRGDRPPGAGRARASTSTS